jgi:putative ABC transport system ATP-binding protein
LASPRFRRSAPTADSAERIENEPAKARRWPRRANPAESSAAAPVPDPSDLLAAAVTGTTPSTAAPALRARGLVKRYGEKAENAVTALRGVSLDIQPRALTAVMGPSGSGKSTLMHVLAGLDRVDEGQAWIGERDVTKLSDAELTELRRRDIGFVFQFFNLLPMLTAIENIMLPSEIAGRAPDADWTGELIAKVGLGDRLDHRPSELSGGQQQRVAVARALVTRPAVVFADEPTGNLDSSSSAEILQLLRDAVDSFGQTIVMVTHDPSAAAIADRVLFLADGQIVRDQAGLDARGVIAVMEELSTA